jgi:small subunit ribosomal protein S8
MYINLLTQLKNAQAVKKESIKTSYSKMKEKILEVLKDNDYIENFERKGRGAKRVLDIKLKYNNDGGVINGIKLISKPSRRLYIGYKDIRFVKSGYGLLILSTPKGILTGREARKTKVGGEALFEIW